MLNKTLSLVTGLMMLATAALQAGQARLIWEYDFLNNAGIGSFQLYSVPGSNTVFTAGNANAYSTNAVTVAQASVNASVNTNGMTTNLTAIIGLTSGWWTFVVTAVDTNGIESINSNTAHGPVRPGAPFSLLVQ